ncbi:MAG: hypothetical protein V2A65_06940 [Candidatus Omnitrophota bacterium]
MKGKVKVCGIGCGGMASTFHYPSRLRCWWKLSKRKNITQIGYQRKYVPLVTRMRELVEKCGPIDQFTVAFHKSMGKTPMAYYGGAIDILTPDASHMLDAMLWLGGSDPVKVTSVVRNSYVDNNVKYNALVLFEKGITVTAQEAAGSDKPHRVLGFFAQARDFIDCVKKGKNPRGCLENALKTMQLIDRVYANSVL